MHAATISEIDVVLPKSLENFYIQTKPIDDVKEGFHITLCNGINVWKGTGTSF